MGPVTTNPWLISIINMTIVFGVLAALGVLMKIIQLVDPTQKKTEKPVAAPAPAAASATTASQPAATAASAAPAAAASQAAAPAADKADVTYDTQAGTPVATFFFATGKSDVAGNAATVVGDVIAAGKQGKKLVISGYTDSTGNAAANAELSKKRAQAVQSFFEKQGVKAADIELRKPESTTGAQGNNAEGRRVEVKVAG